MMNSQNREDMEATLRRVSAPRKPEPGMAKVIQAFPEYLCEECEDLHWVKVSIPMRDRYAGSADHYLRPCSRCLPERYHVMVTENHGDPRHLDQGGCSTCLKYVRPWAMKKDEERA